MEMGSFGRRASRWLAGGIATGLLVAGGASAYPGGTPDFQTDVAPYCAACHSSTADDDLAGLGERAAAEVALNKHYARIRQGQGNYAALSELERAQLVELLATIDRNSTIALEFPAQVAPGETFQVTVKVTGGAGPVVAVGLVDRAHRFFARPASATGWTVVGAPTIIGPKGPQTDWLARRPEREGRGITYVNVDGIESSVDADKWSRAKVIYTIKAPPTVGDYPLVGAYFYGTETGTALSTRMHPEYGPQPLGGSSGKSGRIKFSEPALITVKDKNAVQPVASPQTPSPQETPPQEAMP